MNTLAKHFSAEAYALLKEKNVHINKLLPAQQKAIDAGLLQGKNLLICTPTASGKTFIAEMAMLRIILEHKKKAVYVVPLRALASEKYKQLKTYEPHMRVAVASGEFDAPDAHLISADLIIATAEKMDSLTRHNVPWLSDVGLLVLDEIHLLNDPSRGPTLEVLIVIFRRIVKDLQLLGLSATIGNPDELASWLHADLVLDTWRPVKLEKGVYTDGKLEFFEE